MNLTPLETKILRACNGEVVQLPYDNKQRAAEARLKDQGLIVCGYDDDQPTSWITDAGRAELAVA